MRQRFDIAPERPQELFVSSAVKSFVAIATALLPAQATADECGDGRTRSGARRQQPAFGGADAPIVLVHFEVRAALWEQGLKRIAALEP